MAQMPDNKSSSNTDAASSDADRKTQAALGQIREGERATLSATPTAARQSAEATRHATRQAGAVMHQGADTASGLAQAGADATRRNANTLVEGQRQLLADMAQRYEAVGKRLAQSLQENTSDLRLMLVPTQGVSQSLRDLQESTTGLLQGVVQSNMRAAQEIFRLTDPTAIFDLQRRFIREYVDTMLQGTTAIMRAARQTAEQTLRPIEAQVEARQQQQSYTGHQQPDHGIVSDVMSPDVRAVTPDDTVQQATRLMRDEDVGILPVGEGDRLVGVVTDRDVALRLVAEGKDPAHTKVRDVMSQDQKYVFEDEDLDDVAGNMAQQQVRRMPVVNRNKRLVGVVSIGDLSRAARSGRHAGRAIRGVAAE